MGSGITITITADTKDFDRKIKSALDTGGASARQFKSALDSSNASLSAMRRNVDELGSSLSSLGRKMTLGLTAPLVALGAAAVKTATDFDSLKRGLTAVSGSAAETEKQLVRLKDVAKLPGLGFREAIQGSINLQAAGLSAQRAESALKAFGNALATVGKGKTELDGVILALSQIESKGKVSAEEINQLAERVPQIRQIMLRAFGTADTEVIQKAKITSGKFIDTIVAELARLPQVTGGARNTFENLRDSIEQSLLPLGNKLLESILPAIEKITPKILGLLEGFQNLSSGTQQAVIGFGAVALAAGPVVGGVGSMVTAVSGLTTAFLGLSAAMQASLGIAGLLAVGVGTAYAGYNAMIARNQADIDRQLGPRKNVDGTLVNPLATKEAFGLVSPNALNQKLRIGNGQLTYNDATGTFAPSAATSSSRLNLTNTTAAAKRARQAQDLFSGVKRREEPSLADLQKAIDDNMTKVFGAATAASEAERKAQLQEGRLTRQALTEDFEQQEEAVKKAQQALKALPPVLSEGERFMKGFADSIETTGDAFERLGQNLANSFRNVGDLLNGLKQSVLSFFNDLLGQSLQRVLGQALSPIAGLFGGGGGGGGGFALPGGGGLFRTPSTFPSSVSSSALQNLVQAAGGGIGVPASVSQSIGGLPVRSGNLVAPNQIASASGGVIGQAGGFSLRGFGNSIAGAAPFLGASLGSSLGGQSAFGQIAGAAGGFLAGGAIAAATTTGIFSAGATALLTNPFTIAIGAGLLVGSYFLGKASQRKKDEEASGQYLTQALQSIDQLAAGVQSGQIDGGQARQIFESQILGTFKQQISGLKTKSVVESRLKNQVADLRKVFEDRIPPIIADQQRQQAEQQRKAADALRFGAIDSKLIPQFATGGFVGGIDRGRDSVMAMLRPGELVLNRSQQQRVMAQAGPGVFSRAGVPAVNTTGRYAGGGYAMPSSGGGDIVIENLTLDVELGMGSGTAEQIFVRGGSTESGKRVIIRQINDARSNREG